MNKLRFAELFMIFVSLIVLAVTASPIYAIGPWKGALNSGNMIFVPMIHEGVEYIHVLNMPPAVVTPEWASDTSLGDMDFGLATMNPSVIEAIQRGASDIIPIAPGLYVILRNGISYLLHPQACHHWSGGVEHEYYYPTDPEASSPEACGAHADTDPWMWHPQMLMKAVNVGS